MSEGEKPAAPETPPPIQPLQVSVIGVRSDGTGAPIVNGQVIQTPDHQPNLVIQVIRPAVAIAIRFVNVFGAQFLGLLTSAMTPIGGKLLYTGDFLHMTITCASLAFPGAAILLGKDILTIFGDLEKKHPLLTGSI